MHVYFCMFHSVLLICVFVFMPVPYYFDNRGFAIQLKPGRVMLHVLFFFKSELAIGGL